MGVINLVFEEAPKILLVFVVFLLSLVESIAQESSEIEFYVEDVASRQAIEFANVFISPCSCGGSTDSTGEISIELVHQKYTVVTSFIGYQSDTLLIEVIENRRITIPLKPNSFLLSGVTISGSDSRGNIDHVAMGVQMLDISKIKTLPTALGEVDILKSLSMLSGVGGVGEASNGLSIRGGSLDQNLVLYENAPVYNPTHLFGLFSVFTPDAVRNVELYKSNMPAKYGGRISSIIDVAVENPSLEKFGLSGGLGLVSSRISLNTPIVKGRFAMLLSGRASFSDFIFRSIERLKNTKANFIDGTMKLRYKVNQKNSLYFTAFYSSDFYQLDIISEVNGITSDANQYDYSTFNQTLTWIRNLRNSTYISTSLVRSEYQPKILFPQSSVNNVITFSSAIQNYKFSSEYFKKRSDRLSFSIGIQADQISLSPGKLASEKKSNVSNIELAPERGLELGVYASAEYKFSSAVSLGVGLRYSAFYLLGSYSEAQYADERKRDVVEVKKFSQGQIVHSYGLPEPRVGLRWKMNKNASLKASYALTRQYVQNIYNSSTPLPTSRWKLSDRYVKPQTGNTFSLGYFQNFANDAITFGVETYYRAISNVLDYKPGADFFLQRFIERDVVQGKGTNYGVEVNLRKSNGKANGWCNYTYSRSLRKFDAKLLSDRINNNLVFPSDFDRPHVFNGTFNYEGNEHNTFSFNFTYQRGRPYTVANSVIITENVPIPIFISRNNARLPDYHRLDFSWRIHNITTKNTRWKGDWIFTLYNLYNRNNALNIFYTPKKPAAIGTYKGRGQLAAFQLSIFSSTVVSLGYNFRFE